MKRQGVLSLERRVQLYQQYVRHSCAINLARGPDRRVSRNWIFSKLCVCWHRCAVDHQTSPGVGLVKRTAIDSQLAAIFRSRQAQDPDRLPNNCWFTR